MRTDTHAVVISALLLIVGLGFRAQDKPAAARWEKTIQAFERQDREQAPPRNAVLFVGSSSIRFWDLKKSFPDLDVINRGFGGSELADSAYYAPRIVVKHAPRIVLLYAGDNDLAAGKSPERVFGDFKDFVKVVRTPLPRPKVAFLSIKPSILRWKLVDRARQANALIEGYCKQNEGLVYIDVATPMLGPDGKPRAELFQEDRLHLNEKGYQLWASIVRPLIPGPEEKVVDGVRPLENAHAHNDYEHPHPLFDALARGFCSVEADIFLTGDQLLVGHSRQALRPERTLRKLYLDPLRDRVRKNHGRVYPGGPPIFLLIDIKTAAKPTCAVLEKVLESYADILSVSRGDAFQANAVTVVLSGTITEDRATRERIMTQEVSYTSIDGRPADLESTVPSYRMPWISANWGTLFKWKGEGEMPAADRDKLEAFVRKAHEHGRLVRFWATREDWTFWNELRSAEVDLINTDKLAELERYLERNWFGSRSTGVGTGPGPRAK